MKRNKIMIVDDDSKIREVICKILEKEDYEVVEALDGKDAIYKVDETFDLVILDIMMPGMDGVETCKEIRKHYQVPVLFLTAKTTENDKFLGLTAGGDDYLGKPFSNLELLARVNAITRRYNVYKGRKSENRHGNEIIIKDVVIDKARSKVTKAGEVMVLTSKEYAILLLLAESPNKIFTVKDIYEAIWHDKYMYSVNATVMVHIRNLRKKLDEESGDKYIRNVWGKGYCIENDEA